MTVIGSKDWPYASDTQCVWIALMNLKVDFINTDHVQELSAFLKTNVKK